MAPPHSTVASPEVAPASSPVSRPEQAWLQLVQRQLEASLSELFELPDEASLDARWTQAMELTRAYALRPA